MKSSTNDHASSVYSLGDIKQISTMNDNGQRWTSNWIRLSNVVTENGIISKFESEIILETVLL